MFFRTHAELKQAYANTLQAAGRSVSIDVPVGDRGSIDILTDREIICCVLELDAQSATKVRSQLDFYGRFSPSWEKVVVAGQVSDLSAAATLIENNIKIINLSDIDRSQEVKASVVAQRASSSLPRESQTAIQRQRLITQSDTQSDFVYRYPKLDSVEGGDGLRAVIGTMGFVFLLGIAIALIQS